MRSAGRIGGLLAVLLCAGPALTGCSGASAAGEGGIRVVASTDVWGSVVQAVGAGRVAVTSLIDDPAKDPHEFQPSVRDELAVTRARIVVENGGGYDDFLRRLVATSHPPVTIDAVRLSGLAASASDFNEHVWLDLPVVRRVADAVNAALIRQDPAHRADYAAALRTFHGALDALAEKEAAIRHRAAGRGVAVTEPVPLDVTAACGLVDRTPRGLAAAIDDGRDVPPAALHAELRLLEFHRVALLAVNAQTAGPTTDQIIAAARAARVPVVRFTETLPAGGTFVSMFHGELAAIDAAVAS